MSDLVKRETTFTDLSVDDVARQVAKIQTLMGKVMTEGEHFGIIPGTKKPSLYQPGAQKLSLIFRLGDQNARITKTDLSGLHREYQVVMDIVHIPSGQILAQGVGLCSTMESKYRYRENADYEITDMPIPVDAKEKKQEYRRQGFGMKKLDDVWIWVRYKDSTSRMENPDIADTYNTVLKMAYKRAHVAGVIRATAASDIFTQDMEDFPETKPIHEPEKPLPPSITPDMSRAAILGEIKAVFETGAFTADEIAAARGVAKSADAAGLERLRQSLMAQLESRRKVLDAVGEKAFSKPAGPFDIGKLSEEDQKKL